MCEPEKRSSDCRNNVTSLFVTIQTIGGMLGPFIGAPLLAGTSNPFGLRDNYHGEPGGK